MLGDSTYTIIYQEEVVKDDIKRLSHPVRKRIAKEIEKKLTSDPLHFGKPLRYSYVGHRRLRVGDYRVVYKIVPRKKEVIVIAIKHRKDVYLE